MGEVPQGIADEQAEYRRYCEEAKALSMNLDKMFELIINSVPGYFFLSWNKKPFSIKASMSTAYKKDAKGTVATQMLDVEFDTADKWSRKFSIPASLPLLEEHAAATELSIQFQTPSSLPVSKAEELRLERLEWKGYVGHCLSVEGLDVQELCDVVSAAAPGGLLFIWEKHGLKILLRSDIFVSGPHGSDDLEVKFETSKGSRKFFVPITRAVRETKG